MVSPGAPRGVQVMNRLFQLDRVADPHQLERILSLEYLVCQCEGRIRVDFHDDSAQNHTCRTNITTILPINKGKPVRFAEQPLSSDRDRAAARPTTDYFDAFEN